MKNKVMQINILDAKNRLSELIQSVLAGEEIVIAKRGNPVVRLVPYVNPDHEQEQHAVTHISTWLRENPLPNHLKRSHDDIEKSIRAQRESWD